MWVDIVLSFVLLIFLVVALHLFLEAVFGWAAEYDEELNSLSCKDED